MSNGTMLISKKERIADIKLQEDIDYCEVRGCNREADFNWRYEGAAGSPSVKVCWYHWRLHKDKDFAWNLFDEFGYYKPPVKEPMSRKARKTQLEPSHSQLMSRSPAKIDCPAFTGIPGCECSGTQQWSRDSNKKLITWCESGSCSVVRGRLCRRNDKSKNRDVCQECGAEISGDFTYCENCIIIRRQQQRKASYHRKKKPSSNSQHRNTKTLICKNEDCEDERQPGHSYCDDCAAQLSQKSNRDRQRRYYKKNRFIKMS